jgi:integrase
LRFISPHGNLLKRKRLKVREFVPPGQSQFEKLLAECDAAPRSQAGLVVRFLCLTGLRISEAKGLKWENVSEGGIFVPAHLTKSGKSRSIPRLPSITGVLERLKGLESGEFILPRQNARKAIESACRRAGLPRMSFHCFRHYFTTKCIESGVDMPTVARWLGHQDGGALLSRTYFHLIDEHSQRMAERVRIGA